MNASKWASPKNALSWWHDLHTPQLRGTSLRVVGFVIYNVRPTNQFYYLNMWRKLKERSTLIFCSETTFAALFSYFSLFHHRGTVSRNYYVKQYIKKWVLVFFAVNNSSHLFWEQKCSPELTYIVCFQKCRPVRNNRDSFPKNISNNPSPQLSDEHLLYASPCTGLRRYKDANTVVCRGMTTE